MTTKSSQRDDRKIHFKDDQTFLENTEYCREMFQNILFISDKYQLQ